MIRTVDKWAQISWLSAGFSGRLGGVTRGFGEVPEGDLLNLGFVPEDAPEAVAENRRRLLDAVEGEAWSLAVVKQVHGVVVKEVSAGSLENAMEGGRGRWEADGLITAEPGILIGVGAADCVPLLVADLSQRLVGGFHAGWRGTAAGMAGEGLRRMHEVFGTRAEDCVAAIGPSIGACCYEVGDEVADAFAGRPEGGEVLTGGAGRWRLDLWEANRRQLVAAGLPEAAITVIGECTACSRDAGGRRQYFSHRAEKGRTGRMLGVIGIRRNFAGQEERE